jgi:very-short-patch-repair endonuclease
MAAAIVQALHDDEAAVLIPPRRGGWIRAKREDGWGASMADEIARKLRTSMTRQEVKLWVKLRELRELGYHFRRQSPIAHYIVDFECRQSRLVIEVDGNQHGFDDHRRRDEVRDKVLAHLGYRTLGFANFEVDREFEGVLEAIRLALEEPHPTAARPPSPEEGEG